MPLLRNAGRQASAIHHVGGDFKDQLSRHGGTVAVQNPGHSQEALLKQGNLFQGGGTVRSVAFQQKGAGRKDWGRVRQPYFRVPGGHGRQQAQDGQPEHGRLDDGTAVPFYGGPFLFVRHGQRKVQLQFMLFIHFLFPHLYLEEGSEVIPHQGEEVKIPARQGPGLVAEIRTQEEIPRNHEGAEVRRLVEQAPLVQKTGEGELLDAVSV